MRWRYIKQVKNIENFRLPTVWYTKGACFHFALLYVKNYLLNLYCAYVNAFMRRNTFDIEMIWFVKCYLTLLALRENTNTRIINVFIYECVCVIRKLVCCSYVGNINIEIPVPIPKLLALNLAWFHDILCGFIRRRWPSKIAKTIGTNLKWLGIEFSKPSDIGGWFRPRTFAPSLRLEGVVSPSAPLPSRSVRGCKIDTDLSARRPSI